MNIGNSIEGREQTEYIITKMLLELLLFSSIPVVFYLLLHIAHYPIEQYTVWDLMTFLFSLAISGVLLHSRLTLTKPNYRTIFKHVSASIILLMFWVMLIYGVAEIFPWMIIGVMIHGSGVVVPIGSMKRSIIGILLIPTGIKLIHLSGIFLPHQYLIGSDFFYTMLLLILLLLNLRISQFSCMKYEYSTEKVEMHSSKATDFENLLQKKSTELKEVWIGRIKSLDRFILLGRMSMSMIHDLKTPLSSINLSLEFIRNGMSVNSSYSESYLSEQIHTIRSSIDQIGMTIENGYQIMTGRECDEFFSVSKQLEICKVILSTILQNSDILLRINNLDSATVYGNSVIFRRVILNLLMNSIEELTERNTDRVDKIIEITLRERNDSLYLIEIRDNGMGIQRELINRIFDEGFGRKDISEHFGIGLFYVKEMVSQKFGGKVKVSSVIGEGTTVQIQIPKLLA